MKKLLFCVFVLLFSINSLQAEIPFTVEIQNITVNGGNVYLRVYSNEASFRVYNPDQLIVINPNNVTIIHEIQIPESGYYVLAIHQDTNGNGDMDYNILKIPQEPYGFSNMRGKIPGNFNQMRFRINNVNERIVITFIKY